MVVFTSTKCMHYIYVIYFHASKPQLIRWHSALDGGWKHLIHRMHFGAPVKFLAVWSYVVHYSMDTLDSVAQHSSSYSQTQPSVCIAQARFCPQVQQHGDTNNLCGFTLDMSRCDKDKDTKLFWWHAFFKNEVVIFLQCKGDLAGHQVLLLLSRTGDRM